MHQLASDTLPDLTGQFIDDGALELVALLGARGKENELIVHRMVSDHTCVITLDRYFVTDAFVVPVSASASAARPHTSSAHSTRSSTPSSSCIGTASITGIQIPGIFFAIPLTAITNEFCGTPIYMSPGLFFISLDASLMAAAESLDRNNPNGCHFARHSDMWAISVIVANLISGRRPWWSADPCDRGFAALRSDDTYLIRALNITPEANALSSGASTRTRGGARRSSSSARP
ncbi:hypothetical protein GGX14DRAFT_677179 [Mycena pura]|uniref:Protein kinase domain-containing protein n=1 Tax=Mycena pura TaxID=153505 RepID=A0AAD6Y5Q6_9AGAR|nr:hypothetical protein GGX14DRAFT_677179 [Mycena pura]